MLFNRMQTLVALGLIVLIGLPPSVHAVLIKCWENKHGVRECGSVVPPEYSQGRIEIVNERGLTVKVIEAAKTPEELVKERELLRALEERERLRKEQARQDAILLNTYTTERDLILARDNNLKAVQGQIDISNGNLRVLQDNLRNLQERAANYERSGKKPPEKTVTDIESMKTQIEAKQRYIQAKVTEKTNMEQRYEEDLSRFRKLKSGRITTK